MPISKLIIVMLSISYLLVGCEDVEMKYETVSEIKEDGAIKRGWIPSWIPDSAFNIKELHSLDSNKSILAFSYKASNEWKLPAHCKKTQASQLKPARYERDWWPKDMLQAQSFIQEFQFYQCEKDLQNLAVNFISGKVYFWRT